MCGIVGILNRDVRQPVDRELLERMTDAMSHRGPDGRGVYIKDNIGLGHRRLSIIDLAGGHQPMIEPDSGNVIVFNGEIYNYRSIRNSRVGGVDSRYLTSSDTEVLLHTVSLDDLRPLELLNGMFSFGFWESATRSLLLARDRLGVKPLYYVDLGTSFAFSSEIKPLLLLPGIRRQVNEDKIAEYLAFRNIAGNDTFFSGIHQVPPGHVLILRPGTYAPKCERFWKEGANQSATHYVSAKNPEEQFLEIFRDSVSSRLISDVPVGTFNSGGVDSSLVTAIARSFKKDELHTFSVGFEEATHDESRYANIVSKQFNTNHHALRISETEYAAELESTVWRLEEPINHPHTVQILLLSKLAREFVTVVLTGEGSDEVFGGYPRYNVVKLDMLCGLMPALVRRGAGRALALLNGRRLDKLSRSLGRSDWEQAAVNAMFASSHDVNRISRQELNLQTRKNIYLNRFVSGGDSVDKLLYYDQRTYLPSLLMRLDKTSMAASIEARVPFLDYRLVEWSYKIPSSVKIRGLVNKWIVKGAADQILPREIVHRKKFGFDVPIGQWLRNPKGLGRFLDLLRDSKFRERGYFDHVKVSSLVEQHLSGERDHTEIVWGLLGFEMWCRKFIDSPQNDASSPAV